ncbi:MAG: T9SS type A sorting domain-containing protein [Porphyromonadaceae bacterium]|nr:T9SS type A sorting domain-containing protein [Porphyromonadaceae bacterium]
MRKITFILLSFLFSQLGLNFISAESVTIPDPSKDYTIKHGGGMYLSRSFDSESPVIKMYSGENDQHFKFILLSGEGATAIYQLFCVGSNEYVSRKDDGNSWSMSWVADPNNPDSWPNGTAADKLANAQFQIVEKSDDNGTYVVFKNVAGGGFVGVDATGDNSSTYANKSETNSKWYIAEVSEAIDKSALQDKYNEAKSVYDNTTGGTGSDQFPEDQRTALNNALEAALTVINNSGATVADVNNELIALTAALDEYRLSVYPFQPSATSTFYLEHSSGLFYDQPTRTITNPTFTPSQQFEFVSVGDYYYNIKSVSTGEFLTRGENGYSLVWGVDPTTELAHFIMKSNGAGAYTIKCLGLSGGKTEENSFMGTDNNTAGSGVYIDKNGKDGKHNWKITDITSFGVIKDGLEDILEKVNEFLLYAEKGDGPDQYATEDYDLLVSFKADAEAVFANPDVTQEQVNYQTNTMIEALTLCLASVKPMAPDAEKDYSIIHSSQLHLNSIPYVDGSRDNTLNIVTSTQADSQKVRFIATDIPDAYNITIASVPGMYLTRCTDPHPTEIDNFDDYKLIWDIDPTSPFAKFEIKKVGVKNYYTIRCITEGPRRTNSFLGTDSDSEATGIYIDKTGTNINHYWNVVEFDLLQSVENKNINNVYVTSTNGRLQISKLEGNNRISVYNSLGQIIRTSLTKDSEFETQLPKGIYIINIAGDSPFKGKVIVR